MMTFVGLTEHEEGKRKGAGSELDALGSKIWARHGWSIRYKRYKHHFWCSRRKWLGLTDFAINLSTSADRSDDGANGATSRSLLLLGICHRPSPTTGLLLSHVSTRTRALYK
jgi:hypothetical protein